MHLYADTNTSNIEIRQAQHHLSELNIGDMVFGGKTSIFQTKKKESSSLHAVTTFRLHKSIITTAQHWSMANDDVYTRNVYKTAYALHCYYSALKAGLSSSHTHTHAKIFINTNTGRLYIIAVYLCVERIWPVP